MMSPFFCAAPPCAKYSSRRPAAPPQHVFCQGNSFSSSLLKYEEFPGSNHIENQQSYIIIQLVISYIYSIVSNIVVTFANPLIQVLCLSWGLGYSSMLSVQWCTLPLTLWCCQPPPGCSHLPTLTAKLRLWQKGSGGSKRSGGFIKALAACDDSSLRLLSTTSVVTHWWCSLASRRQQWPGPSRHAPHQVELLVPGPSKWNLSTKLFLGPSLSTIGRVRCADLIDIWRELKAKKNSAFRDLASWMWHLRWES